MTKQSSHPRRWRRSSLLIAMLATLAFAGGGQALVPAPAAALHIDACEQPQSGLCNPVDDSPATGDSQSGQSGGAVGGFGSKGPSVAPWDHTGPSGVPDWMVDAKKRDAYYRHLCGKISDRVMQIEERIERINALPAEAQRDEGAAQRDEATIQKKKLKRQVNALNSQAESFNCLELGF